MRGKANVVQGAEQLYYVSGIVIAMLQSITRRLCRVRECLHHNLSAWADTVVVVALVDNSHARSLICCSPVSPYRLDTFPSATSIYSHLPNIVGFRLTLLRIAALALLNGWAAVA